MSNRLSEDDYHELAKKKRWKWLGPSVPNTETKTGWQCDKGHKFDSTYQNVKVMKRCPVCWGRKKLTEEDYIKFADENGIVFKGPLPKNTTEKTNWGCDKGHTWQRSFRDAKKTSRCPFCTGRRKVKKKPEAKKPKPKTVIVNGVTFKRVPLESPERLRWFMVRHKERKLAKQAKEDVKRDFVE